MSALLAGELAWYVTGRFYRTTDGSLADYGYFLQLGGIPGDLFNGTPSETTAWFTFAADPFTATPVFNGPLSLALDAVGGFSVYLQQTPAGTFDNPASFAAGQCIAQFQRTSVVMGTAVSGAVMATGAQSLFSSNVFSARLTSSTPFEFGGAQYDLAQILGQGVTQFGTASAIGVAPPTGYDLVVPFSGSALALGGG